MIAAGFGGGTALFIPVIASMIRTQRLSGGVHLHRHLSRRGHPDRRAIPASSAGGARGRQSRAPASSAIGQHQFTTGEMLRTPQFYVLYASFVMMATGGLLVTANAGSIARSWGIPAAALAAATSLNALANGGSRIFWGWASDRIGREHAMGMAFMLQAMCLVLVLTVGRLSGTFFTITLVLRSSRGVRSSRCSRPSSATTTARSTRPRITA